MDRIRIIGGTPLHGVIPISGAKNAALPLMAAGLLTDETLVLERVPGLADIKTMTAMLEHLGAGVVSVPGPNGDRALEITTPTLTETTAPYDLVRKMRASVLVLGPVLARTGVAEVSLPGGCAIGNRPVDLHLKAFEALGATISLEGGYIRATAEGGLTGGRIVFPMVSVGATENALMAAALAKGESTIVNAAREPEIVDLARCLKAMGAEISGEGTGTITVTGVERLHGATHRVTADRIEAGTYAMAASITGGELTLTGIEAEPIAAVITKLSEAGVEVTEVEDGLHVRNRNGRIGGVDVMTEPFPGFPTDLQAQFMTLMAVSKGAAMITETIFENRFMHVPELCRMGANITVHHASALVRGVERLKGAPVMATDLRASVSLVLAGLAAEGETIVNRVYHLDRGYERIEEKLSACGATVERLTD
ncbi:MAG: UDP-N-acetylglucosamine 1-carboxyvinyltransferase [Alphaproteobacteria bacterium]|nr:UDP-N-acetylglucosamine 1-carboxyvinyltransferase [Alphaproteobacteria bacterium]